MNALLVVAKQPIAGHTKTRLSPPLTPGEAARLYEMFLRDTLNIMRDVAGVQRIIAYLPEEAEDYFRTLASDFGLLPQCGPDLGARLDNALTHCLINGFERAVIMNSDSPTLPAEHLRQAFVGLETADVVLGPCDDGGYYLIGLNCPAPCLLRDVQMSTPTVARDTIALAAEEGLQLAQLPAWYDVDTVVELERLRDELALLPAGQAPHTRSFLEAFWPALCERRGQ